MQTQGKKVELILCFFAPLLLLIPSFDFPNSINLGSLLLTLSTLFLFQTLIRDIFLLSRQRKLLDQRVLQTRSVFCLETTVGIIGVILGSVLLLNFPVTTVSLSELELYAITVLVMLICYLIRDYVISWAPFRIFKDPDHINIVVSFK